MYFDENTDNLEMYFCETNFFAIRKYVLNYLLRPFQTFHRISFVSNNSKLFLIFRYILDFFLVYSWLILGIFLIYSWFIIGLFLIYSWFILGLFLLYYGTAMVAHKKKPNLNYYLSMISCSADNLIVITRPHQIIQLCTFLSTILD